MKYKIRVTDFNRSVRAIGAVLRKVLPYYTLDEFKYENSLLDKALKGHWISAATTASTAYVTRKDGSKLRLLICRSREIKPEGPVTGLLWIHGGGYASGIPEMDSVFTTRFCKDGSCIAVLPDYTRSTEAPYPCALEDCYLALRWMWKNAEKLGINRRQIFVGGDSAGGGLTVAVCLYARDQGKIPIAFQMPLYPMLDDRQNTESATDNDAPVWNTESNRLGWDLYLRSIKNGNVPYYAAPARARDYRGLPPACTFVGTIEPFHDETVAYCRHLRKAGIEVFMKEYPGCFHAFDEYAYWTKPARDARAFLHTWFKHAQVHYFCDANGKE